MDTIRIFTKPLSFMALALFVGNRKKADGINKPKNMTIYVSPEGQNVTEIGSRACLKRKAPCGAFFWNFIQPFSSRPNALPLALRVRTFTSRCCTLRIFPLRIVAFCRRNVGQGVVIIVSRHSHTGTRRTGRRHKRGNG